jgi:hypothetical protein
MSRSKSGKRDPVLEGVELLFHQKGGSASFGPKIVLSLNEVYLGCTNSITGSTCRAKCSNILHDMKRRYIQSVYADRGFDKEKIDIQRDVQKQA